MQENYTNDYMIAAHHKDDHSAVRVGPSRPDAWINPYEYTTGCNCVSWPPTDRDKLPVVRKRDCLTAAWRYTCDGLV